MFNWRMIPANEVREILARWNAGQYPPSTDQMERILWRLSFTVIYWPAWILPSALTDYERSEVWIPESTDAREHAALLHETAEILLRRPIAPEFRYPYQEARDEFHAVASIIEADSAPLFLGQRR